jgi:hypothetical protein
LELQQGISSGNSPHERFEAQGHRSGGRSFERIRQEARQCHADVRLLRRIGSGAPTCGDRANRRKREHPTKLVGIYLRQRSDFDASDGVQDEQRRCLKLSPAFPSRPRRQPFFLRSACQRHRDGRSCRSNSLLPRRPPSQCWQTHARRPACVLLNNQATDRLTNDLFKPAWPFGLGSCPKVNHDADDADRVPEGDQRIWSRAHGAPGLDPEWPSSDISDSFCAERQPLQMSRRTRRQGVRQQIRSNSEQKTPRDTNEGE